MFKHFNISIALLILGTFCCLNAIPVKAENKVTIDVYYESMCMDTVIFITRQLTPAYNAGLKNYVHINFIPFGKATVIDDTDKATNYEWSTNQSTGKTTFRCQNGVNECLGNRAQACVLYEISQRIDLDEQQQKMVNIVDCVMSQGDPSHSVIKCAKLNELDDESISNIKSCCSSKLGDKLLVSAGMKTLNFESPMRFVPTVAINGVKNQRAFHNFKREVCKHINSTEEIPVCI